MLWDILILVKIGLVKITLLKLILLKQEVVICVINLLEEKNISISSEEKDFIEKMVNERNEAKKNKDFVLADRIREELSSKGIIIKDTREGTIYEIK
jgi:cysteinyl-tRNA synthetase